MFEQGVGLFGAVDDGIGRWQELLLKSFGIVRAGVCGCIWSVADCVCYYFTNMIDFSYRLLKLTVTFS